MTLPAVPSVFVLSGVSDQPESFVHLAEGTLLSLDVVFDFVCGRLILASQPEGSLARSQGDARPVGIFTVWTFARPNHLFRGSLQICPETDPVLDSVPQLQARSIPNESTCLRSRLALH